MVEIPETPAFAALRHPLAGGGMSRPFLSIHNVKKTLFYYIHFINKPSCTAELVDYEEHIADVNIDTSLKIRLEHHVAAHRFPVSVECKSDEFAS